MNTLIRKIKSESVDIEEQSLHSFETRNGICLSLKDREMFSLACASYGTRLIERISVSFYKFKGETIPLKSIQLILRRALFPLLFFYWNQIFKLSNLLNDGNIYSVFNFQDEDKNLQVIEEFEKKVLDPSFNEYFLTFISEIWELKKEGIGSIYNFILSNEKAGKNYLFDLGFFNNLRRKFLIKCERVLNQINLFSRFPVLTFANAESALRIRGFYIGRFRELRPKWDFVNHTRNSELRDFIFNFNHIYDSEFNRFLNGNGIDKLKINRAEHLLKKFLMRYFPIQFLEGLESNLEKANQFFLKNDRKALLTSGDGDTYSTFILACAKANGYKIIKAQHGGHYGYLRDNRPALDIELPSADVFFTWGWTKMHPGKQVDHVECIPMPSPWLSERKKYWKGLDLKGKREFDIIWMPQMMKRFLGSPTGASSISRDVLTCFSNDMLSISETLKELNVKVFCKPYNLTTVALLDITYKKIQNDLGNLFFLDRDFDKGLYKNLVKKANLILWDQPGTGFLECISCGIPTMVVWTRLFCEEEEWCKEDFLSLEKVGLIHRSPESFGREYRFFEQSVITWMNEPRRKEVVSLFCRKYALTDSNWDKLWLEKLTDII